MGWQDRDYARVERTYGGGTFGGTFMRRRGRFGGRWSVVKKVMVANIALFLLGMLFWDGIGSWIYNVGVMQAEAVWHGQVWRLVTSTYLHDLSGYMHIFVNMLGLYFLGPPVEQRWGPKKFFAIYTISGVLGNVALAILARPEIGWIDARVPALGASGSILGLLGACAVLFPHAEVLVWFILPVKIRTAAIVFGGLYVLNVLQRGANYGGDACHLAGLIFGTLWAWKGDAWWTRRFGYGRHGSGWESKRSSFAEAVKPAKWKEKVASKRADQREVDRILKKVYETGIHSLTEQEREELMEATERQRHDDARHGRVDRL